MSANGEPMPTDPPEATGSAVFMPMTLPSWNQRPPELPWLIGGIDLENWS